MPQELDMATVKLVAEAAANAAAEKVSKVLRKEISQEFTKVEQALSTKIEHEFELRFGEMKPSDHLVAHKRLDTMFSRFDDGSRTIWKTLIGKAVELAIIVFAVGMFVTVLK